MRLDIENEITQTGRCQDSRLLIVICVKHACVDITEVEERGVNKFEAV